MARAVAAKTDGKVTLSKEGVPPKVVGSKKAYDRWLGQAGHLAAKDLIPFRADAPLAYHNVKLGADAVSAFEKQLVAEIVAFDKTRVKDVIDLGLAVVFAVEQANRLAPGGVAMVLGPLQARGRFLREIMLDGAELMAKKKLIPASEVARIRAGQGAIDSANDLVSLAALFNKYEKAIAGKHPITAEEIAEAEDIGGQLLAILKPAGGRKKGRPDDAVAAVDARDRLWTLLVGEHAYLERLGGWLWGRALSDHVPPLQSRIVKSKKKAGKKTGTPKTGTGSPTQNPTQ
jgi:hypothetical protein